MISLEIHIQLKSHEVLFTNNVFLIFITASTFCSEHGSQFLSEWATKIHALEEQSFVRYEDKMPLRIQYIPRNMHTAFALLCFVVVIYWLIFPYPSGLLLTIAPVPAKQPWWIWINASCEFIMNDCITTTKLSTAKPCAYFLGYTVTYRNSTVTPQTVMRVEFHPASNMAEHGKWRFYGMPIDNIELV